ncbi:MAG TPA: hypothetical protein VNZ26_17190 [Vicinamibacterales bacterium]|nr:hypothetical protein [Vicinamibacterales bacterium]
MAVAVFTASCTDPTPPAAPSPVLPTITETFSGTLTVGGHNLHPFTVQQVGGIRVSLTSVDPSALVSLGVGTPSASTGSCAVITGLNAIGSTDVQISGTATVAGNFCVSVADPGSLVESVNYTVVVLHS